jgi:cytochrome c
MAVGGGDGVLRIVDRGGRLLAEVEAQPTPIIALAISPDGRSIAAGGLRGAVVLVDRARASIAASTGPACRYGRSPSRPMAARC